MKRKKHAQHPQRKQPIYEDIRWRFLMKLILLALVTLMLSEILIYDQLVKSLTPDTIEMSELVLSMFVLFDLLLIVRYVPDRVAFLRKNWGKVILILPSWVIVKPIMLIGLDKIIPAIASETNILQVSRGYNFYDNITDFIDKL